RLQQRCLPNRVLCRGRDVLEVGKPSTGLREVSYLRIHCYAIQQNRQNGKRIVCRLPACERAFIPFLHLHEFSLGQMELCECPSHPEQEKGLVHALQNWLGMGEVPLGLQQFTSGNEKMSKHDFINSENTRHLV